MKNLLKKTWELGDELPEVVHLKSGAQFEPKGDYWRFLDGVRMVYIDFQSLPQEVIKLKASLKRLLINVPD